MNIERLATDLRTRLDAFGRARDARDFAIAHAQQSTELLAIGEIRPQRASFDKIQAHNAIRRFNAARRAANHAGRRYRAAVQNLSH